MISRRRLLQLAGTTAFAGAIPTLSLARSDAFVELVARPASAPLLGGDAAPVPVWTFDGTVPGPTIRARKGDEIRIRLRNDLDQPTSIHWHGIRIDNRMDGVAGLTQDAVDPGETFDYVFKVLDAGTFWYHSHNRSWEQVERGLYGALIVDETEPPFAPENDVTLVIDDRKHWPPPQPTSSTLSPGCTEIAPRTARRRRWRSDVDESLRCIVAMLPSNSISPSQHSPCTRLGKAAQIQILTRPGHRAVHSGTPALRRPSTIAPCDPGWRMAKRREPVSGSHSA